MSTLATAALRVRQLIGDRDPDDYAISSPRLWRAVMDCALEWSPSVGLGESFSLAVVTLTDTGSSDFALAASTQFSMVRRLRRASDGIMVERRAESEVESLRQSVPLAAGKPEIFYFIESTATRLTARFYPRPNYSDTLDALTSALPADSALGTVTLDVSDLMVAAIVHNVAASVVSALSAETVAKLGIGNPRDFAQGEIRAADRLLYEERLRKARLLGARPVLPSQVW